MTASPTPFFAKNAKKSDGEHYAENAQVQPAPAAMPSEEEIEAEIRPMSSEGADLTECVARIYALFAPILAEKEALRLDNDRLQTKACVAVDQARAFEAQAADAELAWSVLGVPERRGYLGNEIMGLQDKLKNALVSAHNAEARALAAEAALAAERALLVRAKDHIVQYADDLSMHSPAAKLVEEIAAAIRSQEQP